MNLLETIEELGGGLRGKTFAAAAEFASQTVKPMIIETGCFRGNPADGQSTLIFAMLAQQTGGRFVSYELHQHNIDKARELLNGKYDECVAFACGNSGVTLEHASPNITLAYLDSYDFEAHKFLDAQAHQLVELGWLLPKMAAHSAFLLDDCDLPHGGKAGLTIEPILKCGYVECGYVEKASGYQKLFIR